MLNQTRPDDDGGSDDSVGVEFEDKEGVEDADGIVLFIVVKVVCVEDGVDVILCENASVFVSVIAGMAW